jgi:septum formation inhibitor-activating ATPase MinD
MLAAAIGIDRTVEGDVGRLVAGDDGARLLDLHLGLERRQLLERVPAVVEDMPRQGS